MIQQDTLELNNFNILSLDFLETIFLNRTVEMECAWNCILAALTELNYSMKNFSVPFDRLHEFQIGVSPQVVVPFQVVIYNEP